jgi:hypothetical protein
MARRRTALFAMLALCCLSGWATAPPLTSPAAPQQAVTVVQVQLGDSMEALNGPWKFTTGDSVIDPATNQLLWAEPGFDDSKWETVDLSSASGASHRVAAQDGHAPDPSAKGHRGYWGYGWYRIRVQVESKADEELALMGPANGAGAYEFFDNGKLVGSFGDFSKSIPGIYFSHPIIFKLPALDQVGTNSSVQVLAFRVWMQPKAPADSGDTGVLQNAPVLGDMQDVFGQYHLRWSDQRRAYATSLLESVVFALLGLAALSLIYFDRSDRVYPWIGALLLSIAAARGLMVASHLTQWVSAVFASAARSVLLDPMILGGWVMVWRAWFRLKRPVWILSALAFLVTLLMVLNSVSGELWSTLAPASVGPDLHLVSLAVRVAIAFLLLLTLVQGIQDHELEGWLALPALLMACVAEFQPELGFLHMPQNLFPFGFQVDLRQLADLLLVVVLALILPRRIALSLKQRRQREFGEQQSLEVQQVLLREGKTTLPGVVIESEHRPSPEGGGDFFQIIPHKSDGSVLIVAGDVGGKGFKTGMLVSLLVGSIQTAADTNFDPLLLLQALNRRLLSRGDAHAKCIAISIARHGVVTLANAGHIAPYLNGEPMAVEGALPLGMMEDAEFFVQNFPLAEGDKLVLMSDGVAQAADAEGNLFGFERVTELLKTTSDPAEIADAARSFGQKDDVSVISIMRVAGWRVRWHD